MSIGQCEPVIGKDGAPYWHQLFSWHPGLATYLNFLSHFKQT